MWSISILNITLHYGSKTFSLEASYCSNYVDIQHHIPYWMVIMTYYCLILVKVLCPDSYELYTHVELICLLHNCMIKQYAYIRIVFSMYRFIRQISENYFYVDLSYVLQVLQKFIYL